MSMSTKIEDLPDPSKQMIPPSQMQQQSPNITPELIQVNNVHNNVQMDIKKKVRFKEENEVYEIDENEPPSKVSFFQKIKTEFNEENVLLLVVLFIAATSYIDNYVNLMPVIGQYASIPGSTFFIFIKCIMLLLVYIISKLFLLPYFKL